MKRANGTGTVVKLKGNRRKPWFAKATVGYKENGQAIQKPISNQKGVSYFATRLEADEVLAWWNKNKGNIDMDKVSYTFKQLFDEWSDKYIPTKEERKRMAITHETIKGKLGLSNSRGLLAAANHFKSLWEKQYNSLKLDDFQQVLNETPGKKTKLVDMRNLIMKLDDYAFGQDIIQKGYGEQINLEYEESDTIRSPYSYEVIEKIWNHEGELIADIDLILLYSGMRIEELLCIKISDINLEDEYWIGGLKTKAGKNRLIPIHSQIMPIVKRYYNANNEYLFTTYDGSRIIYNDYRAMFIPFMKEIGADYCTHETRYTFRSELDRLGADKKCIDLIMGHQNGNTGEKVYNKRTIEELKSTVELIDYRRKKDHKVTYLRTANFN